MSAVVFTPEDAHRRCKATRNNELLTQAWIEFATKAWEKHHDRVRAFRAASAQITGRARRADRRQRVVKITQDMGRVYVRYGVVLLCLALAGPVAAGDLVCEAVAPFRAMVSGEVWWAHRNPYDPTSYWGWYIPPTQVEEGHRVTLQPQGHPVQATIAFTELGIGGRYQDVRCGTVPWQIFYDGFETGGTAAWSECVGAVE